MKTLIVYYSWHNGNTKRIAEMIQKELNADITAIDTLTPYPAVYRQASDQGKREVETGYCPALKPLPFEVREYDRIIIGTPTWWYTMAPAVRTFLTENDFSGKTVVPFMTNAGWPGTVIQDMCELAEGAEIRCPKEIRFDSDGGDRLVTGLSEIDRWIDELKKES